VNTKHGEDAGRGFPHVGIDLGWGNGLELYAPADGLLEWAWQGTYGLRAIITHDDGTWSLIAHAAEFFGAPRRVRQGDHIGTMGRSGGPWGSIAGWFVHCHQEYHLADGRAVDPLAYMGWTAGGIERPIDVKERARLEAERLARLRLERERVESAYQRWHGARLASLGRR
jgi:murein DD-endopeptidase MepM/ murein hydrolase activator NlpD